GDLGHRIPLEIVAETTFAHDGLLASNLGKKASTNLGAIQSSKVRFSTFICTQSPQKWTKESEVRIVTRSSSL
ncbi:hypothetical protein, partial [Hyphomonas sp.]|uniref:hypothetical protein n=1 Tax=Hyphomonas sp. TaxID=87 RepID=UPI003919B344